MTFLAPTEVAKILSLGNIGLGSTTTNYWKLKFFIPLAQAPIFSESWGLCKIKKILLTDINQFHDFCYNWKQQMV